MPPNVPERHATTIGTLVQWIAEQPSSIESETASLKPAFVRTTDSGLKTYDQPNGPRIYVPIGRRRHLFNFVHKTINHMAATMTLNELKKSYFWPTMRKDCHAWYKVCARCNLLKAKRNLCHARFRGVSGMSPRKRWAMEYHSVGGEGEKANVLGAIDLDSLYVELRVMKHRTAQNVERFVL
jgi:hypothetical protein